MIYLADTDPALVLGPRGGLHLPHRVRARAGHKGLTLKTISTQTPQPTPCQRVRL